MPAPLILLALASASAEAPLPMAVPDVPAGFELPMVKGTLDIDPRGDPTTGVGNVKHDKLSQTFGWERPEGELLAATLHERSLVYAALQQPVPDDAPEPSALEVAGRPGLRWEVDAGTTHFVGTSFDCAWVRIELTTFGPDAGLNRQIHKASLAGAVCPPPGGLGTSGG
jgi:hypothetical protein